MAARKLFQLIAAVATAALLAIALTSLSAQAAVPNAVPKSNHDPCAKAGRDTCKTTGVGAYHKYKYGLRWFGDYRNAIPGYSGPSFCIDLNFWFPGKNYNYKSRSTSGLKNKNNKTVSPATLAKISYATWNYGRSKSANQQAAVMLYTHGQMNDVPKNQVAPDSIGKTVNSIYNRISANANKYAGPYTLKVNMPASATPGTPVNATVQVLSASNNAVPNVKLNLAPSGATAPATANTGAKGTATVPVTPTAAGTAKLNVSAPGLAANAPKMWVPTKGSTAANGQRLVAPASQTLNGQASTTAALVNLGIQSQATPQSQNVGQPNTDQVTLSNVPAGFTGTVTDNVYGPFPSQSAISCSGAPAASQQVPATNGPHNAPAFTPSQSGWYGYQVTIPGTSSTAPASSPCGTASEDFQANLYTPTVSSQANPANTQLGSSNSDAVTLSGLPNGQTASVTVNAYGPFPNPGAISCSGTPANSVNYNAGNGTTNSPGWTPSKLGYYGYQITVGSTSQSNGTQSPCAPTGEQFTVTTTPTVHTQVPSSVAPGSQLQDTLQVSGLQGQPATVNAALYGPFPSPSAVSCSGTPVWTGNVAANGDGTYKTAPTTLPKPGYYVYHETIPQQGFVNAANPACADSAETTIGTGQPNISTHVSNTKIKPGSKLQDHAVVTGLGALPAKVHVELFGPYASKSAISCQGSPSWSGDFNANGDGTYLTQPATIHRQGYYVYRESIAAGNGYSGVQTQCVNAAETSLSGTLPKPKQPAPSSGTPTIHTKVSNTVAKPGTPLRDHISVSGAAGKHLTIGVKLFGPFSTRSQLSCSTHPAWSGTVHASGDGTVDSGAYKLKKVGFYVYQESITGGAKKMTTPCSSAPETSLGRPQIITGGLAPWFGPNRTPATQASANTPVSISIPKAHISAPIGREAISVKTGQMEIPANVHHVGWWQDGATPSSSSGTTLLAGHINYVHQGNGAFYALAQAGMGKGSVTGDIVSVKTGSGHVYKYKITSVSMMPKANLPTGIFTKSGARKLVMVTCGGPYDNKIHHYKNNIVVTATPA